MRKLGTWWTIGVLMMLWLFTLNVLDSVGFLLPVVADLLLLVHCRMLWFVFGLHLPLELAYVFATFVAC